MSFYHDKYLTCFNGYPYKSNKIALSWGNSQFLEPLKTIINQYYCKTTKK